MSFRDIAKPLIRRGIAVIPVDPGAKRCRMAGWPALATTEPAAVERWNESMPDANVGCVAKPDGVAVIDCDIPGIPEFIEQATGQHLPETFTVLSAGRRCPHLYFLHTDASRALGNRSLPGRFDFKAHNSYVVGPGSVLQTDSGPRTYEVSSNAEIAPMPDWLVQWIATVTTTDGTASGSCRDTRRVSDNFDFQKFLAHYNLTGRQKGPWFVTDVCPIAGRRHEQSTETGFYFDGLTLGFKCFASGCEGSGMSVGDVIRRLNTTSRGLNNVTVPFTGDIWERPSEERAPVQLPPEMVSTSWLVDFADFSARPIPPRKRLLWDRTTDATVLYNESLNQIFSQRGIGKSVFTAGLVNVLLEGGEFLQYQSDGNLRVLHCDGELPDSLLQKRLKDQIKLSSRDHLKLINAGSVPGQSFPKLSEPAYQVEFIRQIKAFNPDVIVFDTLSACFRFNTNEQREWDVVNQFYITLRNEGHCVIVVHHAGKNGTQRGITNGDDNLDLSIKLEAPGGWSAGDGCRFRLSYEKVREGGKLTDFIASYDAGVWKLADPTEDTDFMEVVKLHQEGKKIRAIAASMKISKYAVEKYLKRAKETKMVDEPEVALAGKKLRGKKAK